MDLLIELLNFLTPYGVYSYLVMFSILIACGFGLPLPEDITLVVGGILAARGICSLPVTIAVCMVGVMMGDGVVFFLGRILGPRVKDNFLFRRIMSPQVDHRVASVFAKHGDKIVFIARFMPGLRMPIFLSTGIYGIKPWKFFLLDGSAALISVPLWVVLGYQFGLNLEVLESKIVQYQYIIYGVIGAIIAGLVAFRFFKLRRTSVVVPESIGKTLN